MRRYAWKPIAFVHGEAIARTVVIIVATTALGTAGNVTLARIIG